MLIYSDVENEKRKDFYLETFILKSHPDEISINERVNVRCCVARCDGCRRTRPRYTFQPSSFASGFPVASTKNSQGSFYM